MDDYMVLLRRLARVQQRMTETVSLMSQSIERLEREVMLLRAQCVRARTAVLWGLGGHVLSTHMHARGKLHSVHTGLPMTPGAAPVPGAWEEAGQVICQTGCMGHAHYWLDAQGQCRRDGAPCERLAAAGERHVSAA